MSLLTTVKTKIQSSVQRNHRAFRFVALTLIWLLLFKGIGMAQCPLICLKEVNVSMDEDCSIEITPSMVLQGTLSSTCTYQVVIMGTNGVPITGSPFVNATHVGKTFQVKILNGHNSCWVDVKVEDKLPPKITCLPTDTVNCYDTRTFVKPTATDNCGTVQSVDEISNELEDLGCSNVYSAIRRISYVAIDKSGNKSGVCTRSIYYRRVPLDSVIWPLNRDNVEDGHLDCSNKEGWDKNGNKYPDINETGVPKNTSGLPILPNAKHCELNVTYTDQQITTCGASKKILRSWSIMDWCSNQVRSKIQIIKIVDEEEPVATLNVNGLKVSGAAYSCAADWTVVAPTNIIDCSATSFTISYMLPDVYGNFTVTPSYVDSDIVPSGNTFIIKNLPVGPVKLRYKIQDVCGNFTYKYAEIEVIDKVAPDVVCDQYTVITLSNAGEASLNADVLDGGSRDRCSSIDFDIRRMVRGCNDSTLQWKKSIDLCCEDVGKELMIVLRVTDKSGNSNTCMVSVRVQDKVNPKITCPQNVSVTCGTNINNLPKASATDNCGTPTISFVDSTDVNECGVGRVFRKWYAEDKDKRRDSCIQIITINPLPAITTSDSIWRNVGDKTIQACTNASTDPSVTGQPVVPIDACRKIAANYKDQVFEKVDGVCKKIIRTWTVIDWCNYADQGGESNKFTFTQIIKIVNGTAPKFLSTCSDTTFCVEGPGCGGNITYLENAVDSCTPSAKLQWSYELDLDSNGSIDFRGTTNDASGTYKPGIHTITWRVREGCGNETRCTKKLIIKDCKAPTPYCIGSLTTVIMPTAKFVDIWAKDFDRGSFDNCAGPMKFSFTKDVKDTMRRYDCDKIGIQNLQIWVTDTTGNQDFCTVSVDIQDSNNSCGKGSSLTAGGSIFSESNARIKGVEVAITDMSNNFTKSIMSNDKGEFLFTNLFDGMYKLRPLKNDEQIKGLNTLDLVQIQKHILGVKKLTGPYKIIAADANNDQKVNISDIVLLRKLILGIEEEFVPNHTAWNFVPNEWTFQSPTNPWPFNNYVEFNPAKNKDLGFMAIKVGDIDASAFGTYLGQRNQKSNYWRAATKVEDNRNTLTLYPENSTLVEGLQLGLHLSTATDIRILEVWVNKKLINKDQYHFDQESKTFKLVIESTIDLVSNSEAVQIKYEGKTPINITDSPVFESEVYLNGGSEKVSIRTKEDAVTLFQNNPNPFNNITEIAFHIPKPGNAELIILDAQGKVLKKVKEYFEQGLNKVIIDKNDLKYSGLMIYTLSFGDQRITKKMVGF